MIKVWGCKIEGNREALRAWFPTLVGIAKPNDSAPPLAGDETNVPEIWHPQTKKGGFSLVELIVSVGIASLLFLGISVFFSSSIQTTFRTQEEFKTTQGQFVVNAIVAEKFSQIGSVINGFTGSPPQANQVFALNRGEGLPFSYFGQSPDRHLVMKDWMTFSKVSYFQGVAGNNNFYGNPGAGTILNANCTPHTEVVTGIPKNFGGFTVMAGEMLVALPQQHKIARCGMPSAINCATTSVACGTGEIVPQSPLDVPTDAATDGSVLFIADSGNDRVVQMDTGGNITELAAGLNFPTGLAYQEIDPDNRYLFVSDTLSHQVKRIKIEGPANVPSVSVVAGQGNTERCGEEALYCDLQWPTGLFLEPSLGLFIADSGNNRVVHITDPGGRPTDLDVNFNIPQALIVKNILVTFPAGVNASNAALTVQPGSLKTTGEVIPAASSVEYRLFTTLAEDTVITNACPDATCSQERIRPINIGLFSSVGAGDQVQVGTEGPFDFSMPPGGGGALELTTALSQNHSAGEEVFLRAPVTQGTPVTFGFTGLDTQALTAGHFLIIIEIEGVNTMGDAVNLTRYQGLTLTDGVLGTADDLIEEISVTNISLNFPTSATNSFIMNTGNQWVGKYDGTESNLLGIADLTALQNFDYTSDFELDATDGLTFKKLQSNEVLEMNMNVKVNDNATENYILQTKIQ